MKKMIILGAAAGAAGVLGAQWAKGSDDKGERNWEMRVGGGDTPGAGFDLAPSIIATAAGGAVGFALGKTSGAVSGMVLALAANGLSAFGQDQIEALAAEPSEGFADIKGIGLGALAGAGLSMALPSKG